MEKNLIDVGFSGPTSLLIIPESLRTVVMRTMTEITSMSVVRVEAFKAYHPVNFDTIDKYVVKIRLSFDGGSWTLNGNNDYYSDEITKLFYFIYPDYDFIKISVDKMDVRPEKTNYDVLKIWWEGDDLKGDVLVLDTPSGKILKELFKAGITLGISSRGLGSVKELYREGAVEVQEDFELVCWDFVSNPSTQGAFMNPKSIHESVSKSPNINTKYHRTNEIITSILCEDGKCRI